MERGSFGPCVCQDGHCGSRDPGQYRMVIRKLHVLAVMFEFCMYIVRTGKRLT